MKLLQANGTGVPELTPRLKQTCEVCTLSKSVRTINRDVPRPTTKRLERVYTDFWGPFATPPPSGAR